MSETGGEAAPASVPSVSLVRPSSRRSIPLFTQGARVCVLGSATGQDVVLAEPGVCANHARLYWDDGRLLIEALESAPVAVNGHTITGPTPVVSGDWLRLGQAMFQIAITGQTAPVPVRQPTGRVSAVSAPTPPAVPTKSVVMRADRNELTIGRLPESDVRIPAPIVSRHHARIVREGERYFIEDLESTNGTFVNGQRVHGRAPLNGGERLQFGSFAYLFTDGKLRELEGAGLIRVEARGVEKVVKDAATGGTKRLLAGINLAICPGEFVGIFGTSGSGKSTLLDALNGRRPASGGSILYNGIDLNRSFDLFKSTIGYVPQQDIVHRRISIHNALGYTARLRLPEDTSAAEIDQHIERVLNRVGLSDKLWQPIDTPTPLSGGQLKRVSLAIELVANPSILFLDEATSGLDAGTDRRMMHLFADLASDGKTVVCVTHTLENIDACDLVIVLYAGRLVYFGPPAAMAGHFRITRPSDVYDELDTAPAERWVERYEASTFYREYVTQRLAAGAAPQLGSPSASAERRRAPWLDLRQTGILTRRYVDLILADRKTLTVLLAMAPGIGFIFGVVFTTSENLYERASTENKLLILMVMTMVFCGCFNSCREIVKELQIYLRERTVNLGVGSYLVSKILPLSLICAVQCLSVLAVMSLLVPMPGDVSARLPPLFLTGMAATMMGLTVSAMVSKPDMALPIALLISFPQIALANALVPLPSAAEAIAKVTVIAYWGYDCLKATLADDVQQLLPIQGSYGADNLVLLTFVTILFVTAVEGLRAKDRQR